MRHTLYLKFIIGYVIRKSVAADKIPLRVKVEHKRVALSRRLCADGARDYVFVH